MSPPSDEEFDIACALLKLSEHIYKECPNLLTNLAGWGSRKRRSVLVFNDSALPCLPSVMSFERKDCLTSCSPETPLVFPGSSAEENNNVKKKKKKKTTPALPKGKTHKQLVEQQNRKIVSLSDDNAHLKKIVEQYKELIQQELAKKKRYQEAQLAAAKSTRTGVFPCSGQRPNATMAGPTPPEDPTVLTIDMAARIDRPIGLREDVGFLDLNDVPVEVEELQSQPRQYQQLKLQQSLVQLPRFLVEDKLVKSTQARKRRLEIQRAKNLGSPLMSSYPLMKISRLR